MAAPLRSRSIRARQPRETPVPTHRPLPRTKLDRPADASAVVHADLPPVIVLDDPPPSPAAPPSVEARAARPTPARRPEPAADAPRLDPPPARIDLTEASPQDRLDEALADLREVFAVYPFRAAMPACPHCVTSDDVAALGRHPEQIAGAALDRFVAKSLITWGEEADLKRLLPEILTRITRDELGAPAGLVGARLRRASWRDWPAAEAPAVRRALRAAWTAALSTDPAPGRPPAVACLALVASAEDDLRPYLDVWEDRLEAPGNPGARLTAVLHLADLLGPLSSGGRQRLRRTLPLARRGVVGQLDHWLRQPSVVQRLLHAADALDGTPHEARITTARQGLARLRTDS